MRREQVPLPLIESIQGPNAAGASIILSAPNGPADFVLHDHRFSFLDDEASSPDIQPELQILILVRPCLEDHVDNSKHCQSGSCSAEGPGLQELPKAVVAASGAPPRIFPSAGVMSTTPL